MSTRHEARRVVRALSFERVDVVPIPGVVRVEASATDGRGARVGHPSELPPMDPTNARRLAARLVAAAD
jgi:hypothetical protein